jgi:hypothetical protein
VEQLERTKGKLLGTLSPRTRNNDRDRAALQRLVPVAPLYPSGLQPARTGLDSNQNLAQGSSIFKDHRRTQLWASPFRLAVESGNVVPENARKNEKSRLGASAFPTLLTTW